MPPAPPPTPAAPSAARSGSASRARPSPSRSSSASSRPRATATARALELRARARRARSSARDDLGRSALLLADARRRQPRAGAACCTRAAPAIDEPDVGGRTALSWAAGDGTPRDRCAELAAQGAAVDRARRRAAHAALPRRRSATTARSWRSCSTHGADVNAADRFGDTPLMVACVEGLRRDRRAAARARRRPRAAQPGRTDRGRSRRAWRRRSAAGPARSSPRVDRSLSSRGAPVARLRRPRRRALLPRLRRLRRSGRSRSSAWAVLLAALEAARGRAPGDLGTAAGFVFGWVAHAGGFAWLWRLVEVFLGGNDRDRRGALARARGLVRCELRALRAAVPGAAGTRLADRARRHRRRSSRSSGSTRSSSRHIWATRSSTRTLFVQIADLGGPLAGDARWPRS